MSPAEEFERAYTATFPLIWKLCRSFTHDAVEADDLVQETFELAWRKWALFRHEARRATWLDRIAMNVCLASTRRVSDPAKARLSLDRAAELPLQEEPPDEQADVQRLYQAIGQLNELDRLLINFYLEELSYGEIAQITGLRENTIAVRVYRIKKQLAELMQTDERFR